MLELSIFQGQSLGPFSLGTLVNDVIQYLKDHIKEFPCVEVTQASQVRNKGPEDRCRFKVQLLISPPLPVFLSQIAGHSLSGA